MSQRKAYAGEMLGTFIVVFFGVGSVQSAGLAGAQNGIWQVAVVWGVAVALAIYAFAACSGAHFNPAVTIAMACFRSFPARWVPWYLLSQLVGAFAAAAFLYGINGGIIAQYEAVHGIVRGGENSLMTAMLFGEYFPHPAMSRSSGWRVESVPVWTAMLAELAGTAFLVFFIFAVTDSGNGGAPGKFLTPVMISLAVAAIISILAPVTQAGLNPARDFGPRLFAWMAGWGGMAIPGPRGGFFTVYILAPVLGGLAGGGAYRLMAGGIGIRAAARAEGETGIPRRGHADTVQPVTMAKSMAWPVRHREMTMETTRLVVIGGFLGAGKTTLMGKAAQHLRSRGCKVGLITNDQAPDLVDTAWLARGGIRVEEVAGSCFCCNFPGLTGAIDRLRGGGAEIILAEPVGSCTDLSATILQPVKEMHPEVVLTPFTVLLDPARAAEVLGRQPRSLHPDAIYILTMQLTEADRIVLNKTDLLSDRQREDLLDGLRQRFPGSRVGSFSAERDQGVEGWLDGILENGAGAGQTILDIDYDKYANGEAVLGWVNVTAETVPDEVDGMKYMQSFFTGLRRRLHQRRFAVGHVKMMGHFHDGVYKGSLVDAAAQARIVYEEAAGAKPGAVTVNARVECEPGELQELIREVLAEAAGGRMRLTPGREHSLKPGRPNPTHRYKHVVQK